MNHRLLLKLAGSVSESNQAETSPKMMHKKRERDMINNTPGWFGNFQM